MKSVFILGLAAVAGVVDAIQPTMFQYQERIRKQLALREQHDLALDVNAAFQAAAEAPSKDVSAETIELPLDHFARNNGYGQKGKTFKNRYWVYSKLWKPGSPIFIYDGGEGDAGSYAERLLTRNTSFFNQLVSQFNGMGIVWEHRYYGESTPVNLTTATPEDMQYLTTEQALADVPILARNFKRPELGDHDLTPNGTPWVFVGGSYPGIRAAFMRELYPDVIYASWASSAPVQAQIDMGFYFEQVYRGMNKFGFGNCTKNIQAAVNYVDGELGSYSKKNQDAVKRLLLGPGSEKNPSGAIADALSMIFYNWQSYGLEGGTPSLRNFCDWINTDEQGKISPTNGWGSSKDKKWVAQRWASWKDWIPTVNAFGETSCVGSSGNGTTNSTEPIVCDLTGTATEGDAIAWTWQYCTEWGFFQQANFGPNRIVSRYNTLAHQQDFCNRQFATAVKQGSFPRQPNTGKLNRKFKGWYGRPSNVLFTGGEFDPWRTLSPVTTEPSAPHFKVTQDIPKCGVSTNANTVFGYVLENGCHCYDMDLKFPGSDVPRKLFVDALKKWLLCWKPGGKYPGNRPSYGY